MTEGFFAAVLGNPVNRAILERSADARPASGSLFQAASYIAHPLPSPAGKATIGNILQNL
jgi:hypothetical protein